MDWRYRAFIDFMWSCDSMTVLTITSISGHINITGYYNQSFVDPSVSSCADMSCCKSLCDAGLTDCWAYMFGNRLSWCNNGGPCCLTAGYLSGSSSFNITKSSRRCPSSSSALKFSHNWTSYVKQFASAPPSADLQAMISSANSSYTSLQGTIAFVIFQIHSLTSFFFCSSCSVLLPDNSWIFHLYPPSWYWRQQSLHSPTQPSHPI